MNIFYWLHNFTPKPIAFSLGSLDIYWYGIILASSMVLAIIVFWYLGKKNNLSSDNILDLSTWLIIGGIIGARLYDVVLELPYYLNHPFDIFKIWQGGLAIHGALLGGLIILLIFVKIKKINFWHLVYPLLPALAFGQAIGRFGNWFNQELFGSPTSLPFGIPIDFIKRPAGYENYDYFHPTFLYESIFMLIIGGLLFSLVKNKKFNGRIILGIYLLSYGLIRFVLEFIKIDITPIIFNLRWPQIISLIMIIFWFYFFLNKKEADI